MVTALHGLRRCWGTCAQWQQVANVTGPRDRQPATRPGPAAPELGHSAPALATSLAADQQDKQVLAC